jgi:hypothetical protein
MGSRDHAPTSVWFDDAQEGNFDLTMSAIVSTLLDSSDYFNAWYRKSRRKIIRTRCPFHKSCASLDPLKIKGFRTLATSKSGSEFTKWTSSTTRASKRWSTKSTGNSMKPSAKP